MKKLFIPVFAFGYAVVIAQEMTPQHSLALLAGPNWYQQLSGNVVNNYDYDAQTGFSTGLEYTYHIDKHWQVKAGFRYNILKSVAKSGWLRYESEYGPDGTYTPDPSLPHHITQEYEDKAWQYLLGIRWMSKPDTWRWYIDAETGLTDFIEPEGAPKAKMRFTLGAGFGVAWQAARSNIAVFAQPVVRYVFQDFNSDLFTAVGYRFLIPALEAGARRYF